MSFDRVVTGHQPDFPARTADQDGFGYAKHQVTQKAGNQLQVSFMEIPPGRSAFPYHWHEGVTEAYVILSGRGRVRTPDAEFDVAPGQVVVFPPGPAGAHRMTNTGDEPLRYVDLDTTADPDVCHYPDSGKSAKISSHGTAIWRDADEVGYYDGEPDA